MAKLVDALVSGTSVLMDVQVRVLFWAPENEKRHCKSSIYDGVFLLVSELFYFQDVFDRIGGASVNRLFPCDLPPGVMVY